MVNATLAHNASMMSMVISEVEKSIEKSRETLDEILERNSSISSYQELERSKDLMKLYGECADDYVKLCFMLTSISESVMDLRTVRKLLMSGESDVIPSFQKTYKRRIDDTIEQMTLLKEAVQASKLGLEARVRYYGSCAYTSYDKIMGAKC
jgi:hypothetical protein